MVTIGRVVKWSIIFAFILMSNLSALSIEEYDIPSGKDDEYFLSDMLNSYPEITSLVEEMELSRVEIDGNNLSLMLPTTWMRLESSSPIVISLIDKHAKLSVSKIDISSENINRYSPENILTIYAMSLIGKNGHTYDKLRVIKSGKRVMTSIHIVEKNSSYIVEHFYTMQMIDNYIYLICVSVNPAYGQLGKFLSELALNSLYIKDSIVKSNDLLTTIADVQISKAIDLNSQSAVDITNTIPSNIEKIYASTTTYRAFADEVLTIKWYAYIDDKFILIKEENRDVVGSEFIYSYLKYSRGDFPIGKYRVVFSLGEYVVKVKDFTIFSK